LSDPSRKIELHLDRGPLAQLRLRSWRDRSPALPRDTNRTEEQTGKQALKAGATSLIRYIRTASTAAKKKNPAAN
jgi:hypothetical protein